MRIDYPYLLRDVSRHGRVTYYVRLRGRPKVRLPEGLEPRTPAFTEAYWSARKSEPKTIAAPARPGTFRFIAEHYLRSPEFKALDRRLTQGPRRLIINKLIANIGDLSAEIPPAKIREALKVRSPGAAKHLLSTLRAIYGVACEDDLISSDPTASVRLKRAPTDGYHTWTPAECAMYEARWPVGTKARTAYAIGLWLAQRSSDAVRLGRPHENADGSRVQFRQQKNRASKPVDLDIPILPPLREALDA